MLPLFIGGYLIVSIFQIAFSQQSITFLAKDETMQVMPINPLVIYSARITFKILSEQIKTFLFLLPYFMAIYFSGYHTHLLGSIYLYLLRVIFLLFTIPLIAIFLGIVLQPLLVYIKLTIKKSNLIYLILITLISILIIYYFQRLLGNIQDNFGYIRTDAMKKRWIIYDKEVGFYMKHTFIIKYLCGLIYKTNIGFVGNLSFTRLTFIKHFFILYGYIMLFILLAGLVIYLTYYDLINISKNRLTKLKKNNILFNKLKSLFMITFLKELVILWRDKALFRKQITSYFIIPITSFLINLILKKLDLNFYGVRIAVIINLSISLLLLLFANTISAVNFSIDSKLFNQMREDLPNINKIVYAKLVFVIINSLVLNIINIILIFTFNPFYKYLKLAPYSIGLILLTTSILHLLLVFFNDLKTYQECDEINYEQNKSITYQISLAIIISILVLAAQFMLGFNKLVYGQLLLALLIMIAIILIVAQLIIYLKVVINKPRDYIKYE